MIPMLFPKNIFSLTFFTLVTVFSVSCTTGNKETNVRGQKSTVSGTSLVKVESRNHRISESDIADAATIIARKQVPVLCYHHIKNVHPGQNGTFFVSPSQFAEEMKALHDSGYHTILPDQHYGYLAFGDTLPLKPIMITFDDTDEEQYTIGWKEMEKYHFRGVFFIMTVAIGKPGYMNSAQIRELSENGNTIESHTWNHKNVTKYDEADYQEQLLKPRKTIENITGRPAAYFAYPYGAWDEHGISLLKKAGFKMAFTLAAQRDSTSPLYTVRRMMVPDGWSVKGVMHAIQATFDRD